MGATTLGRLALSKKELKHNDSKTTFIRMTMSKSD
jgi:hypothetical protein